MTKSRHRAAPASDTTLTQFDGYEIHGVARCQDDIGSWCEPVPDQDAEFWSLYGHIPGAGLECIGDFKSRRDAEEIYFRITGHRYRNRRCV